ncbi:hypothetical protein H0H87_001039 [Tephrocybe sp. NHM501043]|nr:hypothetical protein H0H87_001039 [Tephrocybe sp. NHM501043]
MSLGGAFYEYGLSEHVGRDMWKWVVLWANLGATTVVLGVVLEMPLALPGKDIDPENIGQTVSPEDYTSLFGWITFCWVYPLVQRGRYTTLNERDVWDLSPTLQSRAVFSKFIKMPQTTLLRKLFAANALDLFLDFSLTLVSVAFNYSGPFFLRRILDAIDNPTDPNSKSQAYISALLAFLCSLLKSQADVQHLWFGRRAATRVRSELMAAIYDKALKRKDFGGVVDRSAAASASEDKDKDKTKKGGKEGKDGKGKEEEMSSASTGKIINLMASDANRVSMTISSSYFIYGAPLEVLLASLFLYRLLSWSAFTGFVVLLLGWPLNSFLAKRSISIQKGLMKARDGRMGVLGELIGAVKFVKFFAWEERWLGRVRGEREKEIGWMVKARINSILFSLLWTSAPILISIISFWAFVAQGNELTIATAFTAIALFNMVRAPLNVIPTWIVQILQTGVALNRIAVYLDEDEVDSQVSALKAPLTGREEGTEEEEDLGLGIENASFKWNEVEVPASTDTNGKSPSPTPSAVGSETQRVMGRGREGAPDQEMDHRFELRDVNVRFPEGELTVITGPTASGKTALLMALLGEMTLLPSTPPGKLIMSKRPTSLYEENKALTNSISYASQSPWLQHQTIRSNILFSSSSPSSNQTLNQTQPPYDAERYAAVLHACCLTPDLEQLEDGDLTEIGARGVSLSGGQKARVALARAVYSRARWVVLDDPLSAVDSGTAGAIVERLFGERGEGGLLNGRTVILVTHHVDLVLPAAHYLVRMLDGRIDTQGSIKDLRAQGVLEHLSHDEGANVAEAEVEQEALVPSPSDSDNAEEGNDEEEDEEGAKKSVKDGKKGGKKPRKLVKDEHREVGGVKWAIYKSYLKASCVVLDMGVPRDPRRSCAGVGFVRKGLDHGMSSLPSPAKTRNLFEWRLE